MAVENSIEEAVQAAARKAKTGSGEITQAVFDEASELFDRDSAIEAIGGVLGADAKRFFTHSSVAVGAMMGLRDRLRELMENELPNGLTQVEAFSLVDLWGRTLGIKAVILDIGREVEGAKTGGVQSAALLARMGSTFDLLEEVCVTTAGELSRLGALSVVGDAIDKLIAMLRAERRGALGKAVTSYIENLPA